MNVNRKTVTNLRTSNTWKLQAMKQQGMQGSHMRTQAIRRSLTPAQTHRRGKAQGHSSGDQAFPCRRLGPGGADLVLHPAGLQEPTCMDRESQVCPQRGWGRVRGRDAGMCPQRVHTAGERQQRACPQDPVCGLRALS